MFRNPSRDCGKEISSCLTTHRQRSQDVFAQEAPDKAQGFKRPFQKHQPKRAVDNGLSLEPAERAGLAVNMAEALSLLAVLQQTCGSHNQNNINTNYAKDSGENVVDKNVGKGRDRRRTPSLEGRSCRARTHGIRPEERRRAVEITTAVELDTQAKVSTHELEQIDAHRIEMWAEYSRQSASVSGHPRSGLDRLVQTPPSS